MGHPRDRSVRFAARLAELRSALAYRQAHLIRRNAPERQQPPGSEAKAQRLPTGPDLDKIRRRIQLRDAKRKELETQIQSFAVPENIDAAMAADEARRSRRQIQDDALKADKLARENLRRGRPATRPEPGIGLNVTFHPTGTRQVEQAKLPSTPEQIARGGYSDLR
jgi:hypothetical protein